ncbi:MAG: urease subunit beta [Pseudomonadota bacterium]
MNLSPTELERLVIFTAADLARRYRDQGIRLSEPEAIAYVCDEVMTAARRDLSHSELVTFGGTLLTEDDVQSGVRNMIPVISVEVSMAEGTKLVTIFDPISPGTISSGIGLQVEQSVPGEIITRPGEIELNAGRESVEVEVRNLGDRTIQVRSHAHFFEVNRALAFDRARSFGMRLDAPSGVGARFDPGVPKRVRLVKFGGSGFVNGFGGLTNGNLNDDDVRARALTLAQRRGYRGA